MNTKNLADLQNLHGHLKSGEKLNLEALILYVYKQLSGYVTSLFI